MTSQPHTLLLQLARQLDPKQTHLKEASASQRRIRSLLETGKIGSCIQDSFLIGSYARHTAVAPIDDIDIMFQIDPRHWNNGWQFRPDPSAVIATFHRALKYRYPDSRVRKQRRSVGLLMSRRAIDIVPALSTTEQGIFQIPDVDDGAWLETAPQQHADAITRINKRNDNLLVPLIKLVKVWNSALPTTVRLKSFAVETMVARLFDAYRINDLGEGLRDFLDFIVHCGPIGGPEPWLRWEDDLGISLGRFRTSAPDLTVLGGNSLAGVESDRCVKFVDRARINRDRIQRAIERPTNANIRKQLAHMFRTGY